MPRKQKQKLYFVYKTTNIINGRYYIGVHATRNLKDGYLGSGQQLRYAIRKYGKENFVIEILEYCKSEEDMYKRERELVTLNEVNCKECYNLKVGGKGGFPPSAAGGNGFKGKKHTKETKEKIRKSSMGNQSTLGMKHTKETKEKIGKSNSVSQLGIKNSQFGTMWITNEKENIKIKKCDPIPDGYRKGRNLKASVLVCIESQ